MCHMSTWLMRLRWRGEVALGEFFSFVPGDPWTAEDFFSQGKGNFGE